MASGEARPSSLPRQGYLPIERKWTHHGKTYSSRTLQGVHEVVPGIWAPDRMEYESTGIRNGRDLPTGHAPPDSDRGVSAS